VDVPIAEINLLPGAQGGTPPYQFVLTAGPAWLVTGSDGIITDGILTGTPTAKAEASTAQISVIDNEGEIYPFTIQVGAVAGRPIPDTVLTFISGYSAVYDGGEHAPVNANAPGYTVRYGADENGPFGTTLRVKNVSDSGIYYAQISQENYETKIVPLPVHITQKELTVTVRIEKPYDGNRVVDIIPTELVGVAAADTAKVTIVESSILGFFVDENGWAGTDKPVTTGESFNINDTTGGNYILRQPTGLTGSITAAPQGVTTPYGTADKAYNLVKGMSVDLKKLLTGTVDEDALSGSADTTLAEVIGKTLRAGDVTSDTPFAVSIDVAGIDEGGSSDAEYGAVSLTVYVKIVDRPVGFEVGGTAASWDSTNNAVYRLYDASVDDATIKADMKLSSPALALPHTAETGAITASGSRYAQSFRFETVPAGNYKLAIFKPGKYVPKIVEITVTDTAVSLAEIKLWLYGDVDYDGEVGTGDIMQIRRYLAGMSSILDIGDDQEKADRFEAANVTAATSGDAFVETDDVMQIRRYIAGMPSVFDFIL
ncbi:hypothetical protein LJC34_07915, partial [Oscillospiraceae bacterium OttesenSCG-928-G22]|nr:hypothetical protein [Oscillospiraceae bacterium OttesenSCG-928-G22]